MKFNEAFPSKYLKAADVPFPRTMRIKGSRQEEVGPDKDLRMILYFDNEPKGLVLGKTTWQQVEIVTGMDDTDHWNGQSIELHQDLTRNPQGQQVPCIRIRRPNTLAPQHHTTQYAPAPAAPLPNGASMPPPQQYQQPPAPTAATPPWSPEAGIAQTRGPAPDGPIPDPAEYAIRR